MRRRLSFGLPFLLLGLGQGSLAYAQPAGGGTAPAPTPPASTQAPAPTPPPAAPPPGDVKAPRTDLLPGVAPATSPAAQPAPGDAIVSVDPSLDKDRLAQQGQDRPSGDGLVGASSRDLYSEDWWSHTRPILELHGYFRTRGELQHNFYLGRHDTVGGSPYLASSPLDNTYQRKDGSTRDVPACGEPAAGQNPSGACRNKTMSGANLRLRLNPEIHISDNLRVMTQIDMLDNLVLGSTPDSYALRPSTGSTTAASGWALAGTNPYAPIGSFSTTQGPPTAGVNGYRNSIDVKRAWAEYVSPIGQVRFGRMPFHWGLGMMYNSGDYLDADYQSTIDRIMFTSGIRSLDLTFGGSWDFISTGPTNATAYDVYGGQAQNTANLSNVDQWSLFVAKRPSPELMRGALSRGDLVWSGGLFASYRQQHLDLAANQAPQTIDQTANLAPLERRGYRAFTPDLWVQVLWKKLRIEGELAMVRGEIDQSALNTYASGPIQIRQWGLATQTELKAVEDKLRLQFGFGWASGDPWAETLNPGGTGMQRELNNRGPISTFRFNPAYQVDLIFFRKILSRVEGAYYFRPSVDYDFIRNANGQKFGGGAAILWSRASEFVQTPGHKRDLGVELDLQLYYQAKDGSLNDDPSKVGGFFAMLQYGVFFPLGGLSYLPSQQVATAGSTALDNYDTSAAQTVRLFLGVAF